jgi:hypothetical protein
MAASTFTYPFDLSTATVVSGAQIQANQNRVRAWALGGNLTAENLATGASLTAAQVGTGELVAANVAANTLTQSQLATYAFGEQNFADAAITESKMDYTSVRVLRTGATKIGIVRGKTTVTVESGDDPATGFTAVKFLTDGLNPLRSGFSEAPDVQIGVESTTFPQDASGDVPFVAYRGSVTASGVTLYITAAGPLTADWSPTVHWHAMGPMS